MSTEPLIVKSELTKPARWYVVTRYTARPGFSTVTGEETTHIIASKKYDVTEQMEKILASERVPGRERRAR